jgi:hypothetical protein
VPYRGDYIRGYPRRGDPGIFGFLGSALKSAASVVVPAVVGTLTGGPVKGIIGAAAGAASAIQRGTSTAGIPTPIKPNVMTPQQLVALHQSTITHAQSTRAIGGSAAGTPHGKMIPVTGGPVSTASSDGTARGYHLDKKTHSYQVRNRRMNWANSRALGRAERRIHSAVRHFSKYIRWVHPGRKGHAAPKFGRKRAR